MRFLVKYFFFYISTLSVIGSPIFNEVMFNVLGNESQPNSPGDRNEFIELYNSSDDTIKILDYYFFDGNSKDYITLYPDSLKYPGGIVGESLVPPKKYIVILDPEYSTIGDSINYMIYKIPDSCYVFTISNTTFGTSGITSTTSFTLFDKNGNFVDSYGTPSDDDFFPYQTQDGYSLEKKNPSFPDGKNYYSESKDPEGNTIGRKNSVYISGGVIDSFKIFEKNFEIFFSGDYLNDKLIVEYESFTDTFSIESERISFELPSLERAFNFWTLGEKKKRTFFYGGDFNPGSVSFNEFMVKDFEWLELYNPYSIDFYFDNLILSTLNDSIILSNGIIFKDSYLVITSDSQTLKTNYPFLKMNILQQNLFSLPDRLDTFVLRYNGKTIDSVIRGFENKNCSIERINYNFKGYEKSNWDNSIYFLGATPSFKNSLYLSIDKVDSIYIEPKIVDFNNPILYIHYKTDMPRSLLNVKIFDQVGTYCYSPYIDYYITSDGVMMIKNLKYILKNGVYILNLSIKTDENILIKNFIFCVR